ncbi:MAG TPA: tRNA (N6-isopentenyl adenosine(37)-C2)-methylthiotransferase MiaB [Alphaproteobacteria bacterium]|nr:tRNA (N6-isopentenyl adenosine(37)-C2)-methylthiotransferase MiaB [Alphaproteobacteria bacterium]
MRVAQKLFIKTYGCQMNAYDSARMAEILAPLGFVAAAAAAEADLVILNTCHIREKAAEKVYSELGRLSRLKAARQAAGRGMTLAVAGCVAQAEGAEIMRRQPAVDLVFGPQAYHRLPEMIARAARGYGVLETAFEVERKFDELPEVRVPGGPAAFLTIQEGCDRFCTFCVVPYTRGAEYSRPVAEVAAEARRLAAAGASEITLLGQNVNAYHGRAPDGAGSWGLGRLIAHLSEIEELLRIRYTTSHPCQMDDELIEAHRDIGKLMPFLHLPVQSGSDRVLEAMNRRHRADDYRRIVERLRRVRPGIAFSSDFIVGYPGESEADFAATLALVREIGFAQAYSFKYSARPGTPAALLEDQLPDEVKVERLRHLQALLARQQRAFNERSIGERVEVLLERRGRRPGQLAGRSPHMQVVNVAAGDELLGRVVEVEITHARAVSVAGRLADARPNAPRQLAPPIKEARIPA